jgi:hypothetical protein
MTSTQEWTKRCLLKKVLLQSFLAGCLVLPCTAPAVAQSAAKATTEAKHDSEMPLVLRQLILELASLRAELREQRIEHRDTVIARLEAELRQLREDRQKIDEEEHGHAAELREFDELLRQPNLDPSERAALEASKANLISGGPSQLRARREPALERERAVSQRLQGEQQLRQKLLNDRSISNQR